MDCLRARRYGSAFRVYGARRDLVEVLPRLYLGTGLHSQDRELLRTYRVRTLINVTHNLPCTFQGELEYCQSVSRGSVPTLALGRKRLPTAQETTLNPCGPTQRSASRRRSGQRPGAALAFPGDFLLDPSHADGNERGLDSRPLCIREIQKCDSYLRVSHQALPTLSGRCTG